MDEKPKTAQDYNPEFNEIIYSTCLYLATILGDLINDIVIVGGLVPYLMIKQDEISNDEKYVGTMDLDLGLSQKLLDKNRYKEISKRLHEASFKPDKNRNGNETYQRWRIDKPEEVTIDFLIAPSRDSDISGKLKHLEHDFAAVITSGLSLAFKNKMKIELNGKTIMGEKAERAVYICGPGAYLVLKALSFNNRGVNKDAYDLYYIIKNFEGGSEAIADEIRYLLEFSETKIALEIIKRDFDQIDSIGPIRVAKFLTGNNNDDIQADVVALIRELLGFIK